MAQQRIDIEGTRWLEELRGALGRELIDIRYSMRDEGIDFVLVYQSGGRDAARQRFVDAMLRARGDIPPFDFISFEDGQVPAPWDEFKSVQLLTRAS